jgi:hypothetical protein
MLPLILSPASHCLLSYLYSILLSPSVSSWKLAPCVYPLKILNNNSGKVI